MRQEITNVMQQKKNVEKKSEKRHSTRKHKLNVGQGLKKTFRNIVSSTKKHIKKIKPKCKKGLMKLAYATAQELASGTPIKLPRIIPIPKTGGFLPLIPIFAGLSAAGSLVGGAAGIAKAVNEYKAAKKQLSELERHNKHMEAVCIGRGLQLKPYKSGLGIYVSNQKN